MLFSIVIPVYNVESYLDECIQSILCQTTQLKEECEVLLIDDGSTDNSGKICDEYKKEYPNIIRVFHNKNHGLLWTRRFGYKQTQGDYVINCDSDDLLEDGALAKLEFLIKKYQLPDIIIFNHNTYDGKTKKIEYENIFTNKEDCLVEKQDVLKEYLSSHSIVSVWGKIVKRTCIDSGQDYQKYGRISTGEDTLQSIEFFSNAKKFVYLNKALYNYRHGSGMTGKFDKNYYFTFKRIFEEIKSKKNDWHLADFDKLLAIKVLQTAGRAITQTRYYNWKSLKEHKEHLILIYDDLILDDVLDYVFCLRNKIQRNHFFILSLLKSRLFYIIIILLRIRNRL